MLLLLSNYYHDTEKKHFPMDLDEELVATKLDNIFLADRKNFANLPMEEAGPVRERIKP